jgi:hypothetical protein
VTGFNNHPRDFLCCMPYISITPFLDLNGEGVGSYIFYSDSTWISSIKGKGTQDYYWINIVLSKINSLKVVVKVSDSAHFEISITSTINCTLASSITSCIFNIGEWIIIKSSKSNIFSTVPTIITL